MSGKPPFSAYLALIAVCFFWGTVYLGFRIALESFPPVLLMGGRFFLAGLVTLLIGSAFKVKLPSRREFSLTALYGVITLGLGVGTLAFATQWIPSGLVALLSTTSPFWMVGIEALLGGDKPNLPTILGMLVGLAGTLLLVLPGTTPEHGLGGAVVFSFLILQLGCGGFALGSILERRQVSTTHPIIHGAVQELATGIVFLIPALFMHEPVKWSSKSLLAVLYLIVFGGIVGYSAYLYAMKHLPVSLVSLYTYVNPLVAVILGSLLYGEKFEPLTAGAMVVIFAGIVIVKRFSGKAGVKSGSDEQSQPQFRSAADLNRSH
jgi:drug/metabolite transporter (DMT)-like permease